MDWAMTKIAEAETLVKAVISLAGLVIIGLVYAKTRQAIATVVAAVLAGFVLWAVNNVTWFEAKVGEEAALVEVVPTFTAADPLDSPTTV